MALFSFVSWVFSTFINTFSLFYKAVVPAAQTKRRLPPGDVHDLIKTADAICFDVDSTVINDEGIVSLASICGVKEEVEKITNSAMSGGMSFRQALKLRLNIIKPSAKQVEELRLKYTKDINTFLTPKIRELVKLLQTKGVSVFLISGGFIQLIEPIADALGIQRDYIYANMLLFNDKGQYEGFDETQLTSDSGGKGLAVQIIKNFHKRVIMVGDGMTDYEASPPADLFIGFGGNVQRQKVKDLAPWYIHGFQQLIDVLN